MTSILGISAYYHDSAAALIVDGNIVAAAQEERFTRKKHDAGFPSDAISFCLKQANLLPKDLDYVGFYEKPLVKFERLLETYLSVAPRGFRSFVEFIPSWLRTKLQLPKEIRKGLDGQFKKRIIFTEHHQSHAASAFFPSPFDEAAILTVDGTGEWTTASLGIGKNNNIQILKELKFPHSLGMLYSAFTHYCGFRVNSGEYKLMGLAPYGEPRFVDTILEHLIDLKPDGSLKLQMSFFDYCHGLQMTNKRFDALFGRPARMPETEFTQHYMDVAASIQKVTEIILLRMAECAHSVTGCNNLCLAGGVALNCVANGRIIREGPFENVWIQPAAGDAGGALGVALFTWYQLLNNDRVPNATDLQNGSYLGPAFVANQIETSLSEAGAKFEKLNDDELINSVAKRIEQGDVVGWMQGNMEFGPRALGNRSILGDPRNREMQTKMNLKIKFRESFRPFAPAVLQEHASDYFSWPEQLESPYMLVVTDVAESKLVELSQEQQDVAGVDKRHIARSVIPAVTHVDNSARLQTVHQETNPKFHALLTRFFETTGCPLLVNTSFNVRGEPIVCTPADAYHCFMATHMDVLVIDNYLLIKDEQPDQSSADLDSYLGAFPLD